MLWYIRVRCMNVGHQAVDKTDLVHPFWCQRSSHWHCGLWTRSAWLHPLHPIIEPWHHQIRSTGYYEEIVHNTATLWLLPTELTSLVPPGYHATSNTAFLCASISEQRQRTVTWSLHLLTLDYMYSQNSFRSGDIITGTTLRSSLELGGLCQYKALCWHTGN